MTKTPLPSIMNDLAPARPRVNLQGLKPREPIADEEVNANSRVIGEKWGASTQLLPIVPDTELTSVRSYMPLYLDQELAMKAAERRVTKTFLIMEALSKVGYRVDERDLVTDRRRVKSKGI